MRAGLVLLVVLTAVGCAASGRGPAPATSTTPASRVEQPPRWRPGDRWVYRWASGTETSTRRAEIVEIKKLNDVSYYVVQTDDVRHYWTPELHWAGTVRDAKVEARMVPPAPWFLWPLEVGGQWTHRGVYEDATGTRQTSNSFRVEGVEVIQVPAGRFAAFKVVREAAADHRDVYWYAPEVRSWVMWKGRRGEREFEEQLIEFRAVHAEDAVGRESGSSFPRPR